MGRPLHCRLLLLDDPRPGQSNRLVLNQHQVIIDVDVIAVEPRGASVVTPCGASRSPIQVKSKESQANSSQSQVKSGSFKSENSSQAKSRRVASRRVEPS